MRSARSKSVDSEDKVNGLTLGLMAPPGELAAHLTDQFAEDRALALHRARQAFELAGMGVATGLSPERLAFLGKALAQCDPAALRRFDNFVARDLQKP